MKPKEAQAAMAAQGVKAIIFDCFGVLHFDPRQSILQSLPSNVAVELHDIFQQSNYGLLSREEYIKAATALTRQSREEFEHMSTAGYRLNTELIEKIKELKKNYKIGLLSNIGRGWINSFFDEHQIHELFDTVVLSGEEGIVKPQPEIYKRTAERLQVELSECVFIDDAPENCAGADAVGMKTILFQTNAQCLTDLENSLA